MSTLQVTTVFFYRMCRQITLATKCSTDDIHNADNNIHNVHNRHAPRIVPHLHTNLTTFIPYPNHSKPLPTKLYAITLLHDITLPCYDVASRNVLVTKKLARQIGNDYMRHKHTVPHCATLCHTVPRGTIAEDLANALP